MIASLHDNITWQQMQSLSALHVSFFISKNSVLVYCVMIIKIWNMSQLFSSIGIISRQWIIIYFQCLLYIIRKCVWRLPMRPQVTWPRRAHVHGGSSAGRHRPTARLSAVYWGESCVNCRLGGGRPPYGTSSVSAAEITAAAAARLYFSSLCCVLNVLIACLLD